MPQPLAPLRYVSTRGQAPALDFADALLTGLADDGGLYVPDTWPQLDPTVLDPTLAYAEVARRVMWPFVVGSIDEDAFTDIVTAAYATFDAPDVVPVRTTTNGLFIAELFHGPTLAFKDVALQLVGRLFDDVLRQRDLTVTVLGATSGDTGSAAMDGLAACHRAEVVILFPDGRVSDVQRRQMTTVDAPNACAVAVDGTFDDCQDLVKAAFADTDFRQEVRLSAVNSINWARVMAQIVYYVTSVTKVWERTGAPGTPVDVVVPTGNFGNVYAAWAASQMGLPLRRLVVASNSNDILTRLHDTGTMEMVPVTPTFSPSMDIQVSSNLERLLFEIWGRQGSVVAERLSGFRRDHTLTLSDADLALLRSSFAAGSLDEPATLDVIARHWTDDGVLIDPHTAVGVGVAERLAEPPTPTLVMATAHPAKFGDAVRQATGESPQLPDHLVDLMSRVEHMEHVPNDLAAVEDLVRSVRSRRQLTNPGATP